MNARGLRQEPPPRPSPLPPASPLAALTTNTSLDPSRPSALHLPPSALAPRLPHIYHALRRHHLFARLVLNNDSSAHVLVAPLPPGGQLDESLRAIVGPQATVDPYYPPHRPSVAPNDSQPTPLVLLRYSPASLPQEEVEQIVVGFAGVKETKYTPGSVGVGNLNVHGLANGHDSQTSTAPTSTSSSSAHCMVHFDSAQQAARFAAEISRTTNWSAVFVSPTGPMPLTSTGGPTSMSSSIRTGNGFNSSSVGVPNGPPGLTTGTGFQPSPSTSTSTPTLHVLVSHPPTVHPSQVAAWLRATTPGAVSVTLTPPTSTSTSTTSTAPSPAQASTRTQLRSPSPNDTRTTELTVGFATEDGLRGFCKQPPGSSLPPMTVRLRDGGAQSVGMGGAAGTGMGMGMGSRVHGQLSMSTGGFHPTIPGPQSTSLAVLSIHPPQTLDPADLRRLLRLLPGFTRVHLLTSPAGAASAYTASAVFASRDDARRAMDVITGLGNGVVAGTLGGPAGAGVWGGVKGWRGVGVGWGEALSHVHHGPSGPPTTTLAVMGLPPIPRDNLDMFSRFVSDHDGVTSCVAVPQHAPQGYAVTFRDTRAAERAARDLSEGAGVKVRFVGEGEDVGSVVAGMVGEVGSGVGRTDTTPHENRPHSRTSKHSDGASDGEGGAGYDSHSAPLPRATRPRSHSASSVGSTGSVGSRVPRSTVHITNLSPPGSGPDKADVKELLEGMEGFRRVAFYRDWIFAVFATPTLASACIARINATTMRASFAREEYAPNYVVPDSGSPCAVLYVCNLPWDATNLELTKLFGAYAGFKEVYFFREACKVYFEDTEGARQCLEDLNARTNLIATFFKGDGGVGGEDERGLGMGMTNLGMDEFAPQRDRRGSASEFLNGDGADYVSQNSPPIGGGVPGAKPTPKCTLHVSNLTRDRADLKVHFQTYPGFTRIAYYPNWVFVVFAEPAQAREAIARIHATTRMQASFAQVEYTPGFKRPEPGPMGPVVRVGNFPSGAGEGEFVKLFRSYEGCTDVRFGREDCLIWFSSREAATRCLDDVNKTTNLCAVYYPVLNPGAPQQRSAAQQPLAPPQGGPMGQGQGQFGGGGQYGQQAPFQSFGNQHTEFWEDDDGPSPGVHSASSSSPASSLGPDGRSGNGSPFPTAASLASFERDGMSSGGIGVGGNGMGMSMGLGAGMGVGIAMGMGLGMGQHGAGMGGMGMGGMGLMGGGGGYPPGHPPKTTLKIGNISLDRADLRKIMSSLRGFTKVAFYRDYVYACFVDVDSARQAMDLLHTSSRMRCVYPKYDYTTHNDRLDVGQPCPILHISNMPFNSNSNEFVKMFAAYEGYRETQFFRESCLVFFGNERDASVALQDLNKTTNLVVVYSKKGLSALQQLQQQATMPFGAGGHYASDPLRGDFSHQLPSDPVLMEQFLRSVSASMAGEFDMDTRRPSGASSFMASVSHGRQTSEGSEQRRMGGDAWNVGFGRSPSAPITDVDDDGDGLPAGYPRTSESSIYPESAGLTSRDMPDVLRQYIEKLQLQMSEMEQRMLAMQRQLAEKAVTEQRLRDENAHLRAALNRFGGGRGQELRRTEQAVRGGYGRYTPEMGSPSTQGGPYGPSSLGLTRSTSAGQRPGGPMVGFSGYDQGPMEAYGAAPQSGGYSPNPYRAVAQDAAQAQFGQLSGGAQQQSMLHGQAFDYVGRDSILSMIDGPPEAEEGRQARFAEFDPRDAWNNVAFGPQQPGPPAESGGEGLSGMGRGLGGRFASNGSIW